jgi:hypothetical protein
VGEARSFRDGEGQVPPSSSRLPRGEYRPEKVPDPPPRFLPVAWRVPPDRLLAALPAAFAAAGMRPAGCDPAGGIARAEDPLPGGPAARVTASAEGTDGGGSRLLLAYDRPPGTRWDFPADERRLRALLDALDRALAAGPTPGSPPA